MSGFPTTNQVEQLRQDLQIQTDMRNKIDEIKLKQADLVLELQNAAQAKHEAQQRVWATIRAMDCYGSGNAGWETRFEELLRLLAEPEGE